MSTNYDTIREILQAEKAAVLASAKFLAAEGAGIAESQRAGEARLEGNEEGDNLAVSMGLVRSLEASAQTQLAEIERALAAIVAGTYGVCVGCSNEIPIERLEVRPKSTSCVSCAAKGR